MTKFKTFAKIDLRWGFNNIQIREGDKYKAAFITNMGLFEPTVMTFGLCNAPATFQRAIDYIMSDLKLSCVLVYLDDINVFLRTFDEHLTHLEQVFNRLIKNNLKLKPSKCQFFKSQIDYLGFVIDKDGLRPQSPKVEAIQKMPTPKNR